MNGQLIMDGSCSRRQKEICSRLLNVDVIMVWRMQWTRCVRARMVG
jgi:hypothetical protein